MDNSAGLDVSVNNEDPFTEGLKSLECESILIKCMQNLEKQVLEIFKMLEKTEIVKLKRMSTNWFGKGCWFYEPESWWVWERSMWKGCNIWDSSKWLVWKLKTLRKRRTGKNNALGETVF